MKRAKMMIKRGKKTAIKEAKKIDKSIEIFGTKIIGTQRSQVLRKIRISRKEMLHVATVNPEYIMEARQSPKFRKVLESCLTVADGHGIVWATRIAAIAQDNLVDRISGTELTLEILKHASANDEKVFLLGGASGVAEQAAQEMSKKFPGLQISTYEGARQVKSETDEEASVTIAKINAYEPDYLLVAYGSPWQDLWIEENRPYLRVRVAMGVGGVFDEWAGRVRPCPSWIDRLGMKWAWRGVTEPWRWKRMLRVLHFGWLVVYHKLID